MRHKQDEGSRLMHGRYANYVAVGHNAFEFLLDFGQHYPDSDDIKMHTRIIINPIYAKSLLEILQQSIRQYEMSFENSPLSINVDVQ